MIDEMVISNEACKYILFQRTAYLRLTNTFVYRIAKKILPFSIYNQIVELEAKIFSSGIKSLYKDDMRREYLSIKDYLPETCSSILDIGCGVAGIDVFLRDHYEEKHPEFYLLDKTHIEKFIWYDLETKGAFYNSLDITKKMLIRNDIPEKFIHLVDTTDNNDINIDCKIDLVISLLSWGFHYPVEAYLEKVYELLSEDGILILDVRKNTNGIDALDSVFSKIDVILDQIKHQRILVSK